MSEPNLNRNNLCDVIIPFREVGNFMKNLEEGFIDFDNKDFYKYLNEKENFTEVFESI